MQAERGADVEEVERPMKKRGNDKGFVFKKCNAPAGLMHAFISILDEYVAAVDFQGGNWEDGYAALARSRGLALMWTCSKKRCWEKGADNGLSPDMPMTSREDSETRKTQQKCIKAGREEVLEWEAESVRANV